jgi:hypothetical protein
MNWGFKSQKTTFFIVTAVKTSNLTGEQSLASVGAEINVVQTPNLLLMNPSVPLN